VLSDQDRLTAQDIGVLVFRLCVQDGSLRQLVLLSVDMLM
jgi:hypothetical protein